MRISLEQAGLDWLEKDRLDGKANSMVKSFNYLQEADCGKVDTNNTPPSVFNKPK